MQDSGRPSRRAVLAAGAAALLAGCSSSQRRAAPGASAPTTDSAGTTGGTPSASAALPSPSAPPSRSPTPVAATERDWQVLASRVSGQLLRPRDAGYAAAARIWDPAFDGTHPAAVLSCATPDDVAAGLAFARAHAVPVVRRSGGHSAVGASTGSGLVLDTGGMQGVDVGRDGAGTVTVGAGVRLIDVYAALAARGQALACGSCATVGIAGISLGGGQGVWGRAQGLTCDRLVAADVVLPDGRALRVDDRTEPDLFWALRGGGALVPAVVTGLVLRSHPVPSAVTGRLTWPWEEAAAAAAAWTAFASAAPDQLWSSLQLSAPAGGTPTVALAYVYAGSPGGAAAALEPLTRAVPPRTSGSSSGGPLRIALIEAGCADGTVASCRLPGTAGGSGPSGTLRRQSQAVSSSVLGKPAPASALEPLLQQLEERAASGAGAGSALLDALGGAIGRVGAQDTAFPHRDAVAVVQHTAQAPGGGVRDAAAQRWVRAARASLGSAATGGAYAGYADAELTDEQFWGAGLPRLRSIGATYDPGALLVQEPRPA